MKQFKSYKNQLNRVAFEDVPNFILSISVIIKVDKTWREILDIDPVLKKVVFNNTSPDIWSTKNVFHDLMSCIIEQQIHYRSTKNTFQRLLDNAGIELLDLKNFDQFEEKSLQFHKMSQSKHEAIYNAFIYFDSENNDWFKMSDGQVRESLNKIKGIGPKVIDMILLYTLQREDIFLAGDFHLEPILAKLYNIRKPRMTAQTIEISKTWQPYRSMAVKYLLASKTKSL